MVLVCSEWRGAEHDLAYVPIPRPSFPTWYATRYIREMCDELKWTNGLGKWFSDPIAHTYFWLCWYHGRIAHTRTHNRLLNGGEHLLETWAMGQKHQASRPDCIHIPFGPTPPTPRGTSWRRGGNWVKCARHLNRIAPPRSIRISTRQGAHARGGVCGKFVPETLFCFPGALQFCSRNHKFIPESLNLFSATQHLNLNVW